MNRCDILSQCASVKISKIIAKYATNPIDVILTLSYEHKIYIASLDFKPGLEKPFNLKVESYSNYANIDKICEKLEKKLRRIKSKRNRRVFNGTKEQELNNLSSFSLENAIDAEEIIKEEKIREYNLNVMKHVS